MKYLFSYKMMMLVYNDDDDDDGEDDNVNQVKQWCYCSMAVPQ